MKKGTFIILSIISLLSSAVAQENKDIEKLRRKMQQYAQAVEKYDTAFIESFFDDRMILTSANGSHRNKQQEINDLLYKSSGLTLEYFITDSLQIIVSGKTGIIAGLLRWKFKEQSITTKRSFTFTGIKKHGWRIIAQHIGRIGNG